MMRTLCWVILPTLIDSFGSWRLPINLVKGSRSISLQQRSRLDTTARDRRSVLAGAAASLGAATFAPAGSASQADIMKDSEWPFWQHWPAFPLFPYKDRKTVRRDAGPRTWVFEQLLGIGYVHTPIRMTIVAMEAGGLFVYAPIAPTRECLNLVQPLMDDYGPIKYIVLPSAAPEHKVLAGAFAYAFPSAEFYVTDQQYSLPVDLPPKFIGLPSWTKQLPPSSQGLGLWNNEFHHEVLTTKPPQQSLLRAYSYQEAAFFHKPTKTLLLCDAILSIPSEPPEILTCCPEYIRALLFHARDNPREVVVDSPAARRKGWHRIAILNNYFFPGSAAFRLMLHPGNQPEYGWAGVSPFTWKPGWEKSFELLSANGTGKPVLLPLVQLAFCLEPEKSQQWIDKITEWSFQRVVPAHFDAPIALNSMQFAEAFDFLRVGRNTVRVCDEDIRWIRENIQSLPPFVFGSLDTKLGRLRGTSCGF